MYAVGWISVTLRLETVHYFSETLTQTVIINVCQKQGVV